MLEYKEFQEEAHSVALHPTGLFILVGFSDKLRLMNLLVDDICTIKEFTVPGCSEVGYLHMFIDCVQLVYLNSVYMVHFPALTILITFYPHLSVLLATVATCLQLSMKTSFTSTLSHLLRTSSI